MGKNLHRNNPQQIIFYSFLMITPACFFWLSASVNYFFEKEMLTGVFENMPTVMLYLILLFIPLIGLVVSTYIKNSKKDRWLNKDKFRSIRISIVLINLVFILLFLSNAFEADIF